MNKYVRGWIIELIINEDDDKIRSVSRNENSVVTVPICVLSVIRE